MLANSEVDYEDHISMFETTPTKFGADNCVMHHVCSQRELFTELRILDKNIGVRGVSGCSTTSEIGTVQFKLNDDDGRQDTTNLQKVVYFPDSAKNLLSIAKNGARTTKMIVASHQREHTQCSNGVTTNTSRASTTRLGERIIH